MTVRNAFLSNLSKYPHKVTIDFCRSFIDKQSFVKKNVYEQYTFWRSAVRTLIGVCALIAAYIVSRSWKVTSISVEFHKTYISYIF